MADQPDPWLQAQQQAQTGAYQMWGPMPSASSAYQVDPGLIPQQAPGGGYASGEDWVKAQAHAQQQGDQRYGPAPGIGYKGQTGPYAPTSDQPLAANYLIAGPDQWAMNGSGPAIAPGMQQAVNEDPRLADLYSKMPVSRLNNIGNGFGVLPGALTPGVMHNNGGQMPGAFNELSKRTAQNPGAPPGLQNLGPWVAQAMAANPLPQKVEGVNRNPVARGESYYDYSSPTGTAATSKGNQLALASRQPAPAGNSQSQMLAQLLMGSGGPRQSTPSMGVPTQPQAQGQVAPFGMSAQTGSGAPGAAQAMAGMAAQQPGGGFSFNPQAPGPGGNAQSTLAQLLQGGGPTAPSAGRPEQALGTKLRQLSSSSPGLLGLGQASASPVPAMGYR